MNQYSDFKIQIKILFSLSTSMNFSRLFNSWSYWLTSLGTQQTLYLFAISVPLTVSSAWIYIVPILSVLFSSTEVLILASFFMKQVWNAVMHQKPHYNQVHSYINSEKTKIKQTHNYIVPLSANSCVWPFILVPTSHLQSANSRDLTPILPKFILKRQNMSYTIFEVHSIVTFIFQPIRIQFLPWTPPIFPKS